MSKKIVLIGGGGHCKSVLDAALRMGQYTEIVITDPIFEKGTSISGCAVVGDDSVLPELKNIGFEYAFITVGSIADPKLRITLARKAERLDFKIPVIIDPSANVSASASIGEGTFVGKNAVVNADARIGKHCILNTGCIVEHECSVCDFTHVSVGAILCGNTHVGRESFIGAGATVIQGIRIGSQTIIGSNSTVLSDVEDNMKVYGIVTNRGV